MEFSRFVGWVEVRKGIDVRVGVGRGEGGSEGGRKRKRKKEAEDGENRKKRWGEGRMHGVRRCGCL